MAAGKDDAVHGHPNGLQLMAHEGSKNRPQVEVALSDDALDWLVRLRSDRATPADQAAFAAWRRRSPAHEAAAREAEALWRDVGATAAAAAFSESQAHDAGATRPPAGDRLRQRRRKLPRRAVVLGGLAASLVVAVLASETLGPVSGLFADYASRRGERRDVRLPDGSTAVLNTATALSLSYTDRERRLTLNSGEAAFDVVGDAARPFVVEVADGEVRALGTVFAVRRDGAAARVVVSEGAVRVRPDAGGPSTLLGAGQQTTFGPGRHLADPEPADLAVATAWRRGKLIFNRRPLAEVVSELDRYAVNRTVILDDSLKALQVTGVFELDEPEEIWRSLERGLQVEVIRLPFMTLIRRP